MLKQIFALVSILLLSILLCNAQEQQVTSKIGKGIYLYKIDPSNFDDGLFNEVLIKELNAELEHLQERILKENTILSVAAGEYATYIASIDDAKTGLGGKNFLLKTRIEKAGGASLKTEEIVLKMPIREGKDTLSFAQLAANIVFKWFSTPKTADLLKSYKYLFVGVGSSLDIEAKKVYISLIVGNYNLLNKGAEEIATSGLPVTTKLAFKPFDDKICKSVLKFKHINDLQDGLSVQNGKIIFETENWKEIKKLMKESSDGLAVDVVQRDQYVCNRENILDNRLGTKGIVTKMIKAPKLLTMNMIEGKEAKVKYKVDLGALPKVSDNYELNLVIVQQKYLCADVMPTYIEVGNMQNVSNIKVIADTLMTFSSMGYVPQPDTFDLQFKIPFELGKFEYNPEDLQPFLNALNVLEYNILNLKISAYSSIEGEEEKNQILREKRAQSIMTAIQQIKGNSLATEIFTSDSWELFYTDILNTEFDSLKTKSKDEIIAYLEIPKNHEKIDSILAKHRFAFVEMKVVYDINSDKKEQDFVMKKFKETVDSNDFVTALKIQKYIMKKAMRQKYTPEVAQQMLLPKDSANFAGMQMNQLWLDYAVTEKPIDSLFWAEVLRLQSLDPDNDYIAYNRVYCEIKFNPIVNETQINQMQLIIDDLATSTLQKKMVDQLNLEYQLKILQSIGDSFEPVNVQEITKTIVDRIKSIVQFKDSDYRSALDLAYLFIGMKDYFFAMQILEPFIQQENVDEGVLFTYISLCTNIEDKFQTEIFEQALVKASKMNVNRFCELLRGGKFSYQFFENPNVKGVFCKTCFE